MVNTDNWLNSLYRRVNDEVYISLVKYNKYVHELEWCYRLGYIDEFEYGKFLEFLDFTRDFVNAQYDKYHQVRREQIAYEQEKIRIQAKEREEIVSLFRTGTEYKHGKWTIKRD